MAVELKEAEGAGGLVRRLKTQLQTHWPDLLIVLALLALFGLVHRFLQVVEYGGDAVAKWHFVRQWWYDNDLSQATWDHHSARMAVNAPTWVAQAIFGRNWRAYYVTPFFMAALQVPFVYLIGKRLAGRLAGMLAVLIITYLATVHRSASQLLPDGFAGTYAVIVSYLYLRFVEAREERRLPLLISIGVVGFIGYLAKETFFFFYPGLIAALWLVRRRVRDIAIFLGILLGGLVLETGLYALLTKYSSRYAMVRGTHGATGNWPTVTFWGLFDRFAELHDAWKYLLFFALASALWLLVLNKDNVQKGRALALIGLSHVFFLTFMFKSVNPIQLWQSFDARYMEPFTPFAALFSGAFLAAATSELWRHQRRGQAWLAQYGPAGRPGFTAAWAVGLLAVVAALTYAHQKQHTPTDAFELQAGLAQQANRTYRRNLPVAQRAKGRAESIKAKDLAVMYSVYMDDRLLAQDGKLPSFKEARQNDGNFVYLVKDSSVYGPKTFSRLVKAGCVIEVTRRGRFSPRYFLTPSEELPASCDLELAAAAKAAE